MMLFYFACFLRLTNSMEILAHHRHPLLLSFFRDPMHVILYVNKLNLVNLHLDQKSTTFAALAHPFIHFILMEIHCNCF